MPQLSCSPECDTAENVLKHSIDTEVPFIAIDEDTGLLTVAPTKYWDYGSF